MTGFTYTRIVRRSFALNGKRYAIEYDDPLPPGTYRLAPIQGTKP